MVYDRLLSQDSTVGHSPILYVQQWENDWNRGWNEHVVPENCVNGVNREDVKNLFYTKELVATEAGNTAYYLKHPLFFAQHVYLSWMGNQRNLKFPIPLDPFFVSPIMYILWVSKLVEDFLAFSMDVILVTLELIHLEFLGWNAVPKNGPVFCEMGLNYDQTNAKLTFRTLECSFGDTFYIILYSCFRVSVSPATWKYVYIGAPMINESHLRWLVTSQTGVVPVS